MKVGFLRFEKQPSIKPQAIAYVCHYHDIEFFYFTPEDVNIESKKISGLFFMNGKWERKDTTFPDIIDNAPSRPKDRNLYNEIKKISPMITYRIGDKEKVYNLLKNNEKYNDNLILSNIIYSIDEYQFFLEKYNNMVIKPKGGNMGKNIYKSYFKDNYYLQTDTELFEFSTLTDLEDYFKNKNFYGNYLIQPYIQSITNEGHPYDIRLHVQRGLNGYWRIVKIYPRIGLSQSITSNLSQGGGITKLNSFLKSQFGIEVAENLRIALTKLAKELPVDFQKYYSYQLDALGIDVGIDSEFKLKIFEINTYPGSNFLDIESAIVRVDYYKHLLSKREV